MKQHSMLQIVLGWILTPIHIVLFFVIMLSFDLFQRLAGIFGYYPQKLVLDLMNKILLLNIRLAGTRFQVDIAEFPNLDRPVILVSNHQSMYDIPLIMNVFSKHHPKFIAKVELGSFVPSISCAIKPLEHCVIDRKDPASAIPTIEKFGKNIASKNWMACIFPEGTRGRDGNLKKFKSGGLKALLKAMPEAVIIPVVIDGSWELLKYKLMPIPFGVKFILKSLPVIQASNLDLDTATQDLEKIINSTLQEIRARN
ncbi:MAG: lysophospholipid acyltransferase family protein [Bdellovibrionota bacterium]